MADTSSPRVLVTGATGFIARHVITQLLDAGFHVRGTARALRSEQQLRTDLQSGVVGPSALDRFTLVEADLMRDEGWDSAVEGCAFVHHIASPVPMSIPKDPEDVIRPARDGTLRVLRAASAAGVRRFVYTSSVSAVLSGVRRDHTFTETDWSDPDAKGVGPYERSKTLAERAAWEFSRSAQAASMEFAVVNPGVVLGPMIGNDASTSLELVRKLLAREVPGCPNLCVAIVDVRDVAAVHLAAMTSSDAVGRRFLAAGPSCSFKDVALVLHDHSEPLGIKVTTRAIPKWLVRLAALFDKTTALALPDIDNPYSIDASAAEALLGRPFKPWPEVVTATADTLMKYGVVEVKSP